MTAAAGRCGFKDCGQERGATEHDYPNRPCPIHGFKEQRYCHAFVACEDAATGLPNIPGVTYTKWPTAPREPEAEAKKEGDETCRSVSVTTEIEQRPDVQSTHPSSAGGPTPSAHPPLWEGYEYRPVDHHHWCGCTDLHPDYAWERRKIAVLEDWTHYRDPIKREEG